MSKHHSPPSHELPRALPVSPLDQGRTNGCGTASLAMALNGLLALQGQSPRYTQAMLDAGNRPFDLFSTPQMLCRIATAHGFAARWRNALDWDALCADLAENGYVLALHSIDGTVSGLHYVVIYGVDENNDPASPGLARVLLTANPASSRMPLQRIGYDDFCRRFWSPVSLLGFSLGFERSALVVSLPQGAPPNRVARRIPASLQFAEMARRLLAFLFRLASAIRDRAALLRRQW